MDLLIQHPEKRSTTQTNINTLTVEAHALEINLENHLGNKVKVSFLPNQYYNEKIYVLTDYSITQDESSISIKMDLREGNVNVNYTIEDVMRLETQSFFNRIEYKAHVVNSELYDEVYNFCLYF